MGKNTRGVKELSKEQGIKLENRELRKEIQALENENNRLKAEIRQSRRQHAGTRKKFARMDLDRHQYVQDIVSEHLADEQESIDSVSLLEKMKNKWKCHSGGCSGHLEIIIYSKMGNPHYFRQCNACDNRTTSQPHHENVEGVLKPLPEEPEKLKFQKKSFKTK